MIQEVEDEDTPLQKRLEYLGKIMVWSCLAICAVVVAIGIFKGEPIFLMCMAGISLAVCGNPGRITSNSNGLPNSGRSADDQAECHSAKTTCCGNTRLCLPSYAQIKLVPLRKML